MALQLQANTYSDKFLTVIIYLSHAEKPLFLLRCTEIGISIRDLGLLTIGIVMDMWTENSNDSSKYSTTITAGQEEFDTEML